MTYAYDNYVQLPTVDLYDTQMMAMAINAAKDMYDRGQQQIKDFYKEYGDFISPFSRDMDRYGQMMGNVRNLINDAYARGIDLARSPEGRALIQRAVYSVDPGEYNRMRTNAKLGFEYLKNVEEAKAKGEFDQDYENWLLDRTNGGPGSINEFSSAGGAMWNRPGPGRYKDANTLVSPLFEGMKDEYIPGLDPTGQYDYKGVSRERRAGILSANLGALLKTQNGRYLYERSKEKFRQQYGYEPSESEALTQYQNDLLDASNRFEYRDRTENKDWVRQRESQIRMSEDKQRTENDAWLHRQNNESDYDWETKKLMDTDRDKKISEEERKTYVSTGGASSDKDYNIIIDSAKNPGSPLQYDKNDPYKAKIAPIDGSIKFYQETKTGSEDMFYAIPNDVAEGVIFRVENNNIVPMKRGEMNGDTPWYNPWGDPEGSDQVTFVPSGNVITLKDKDGNKQSFIYGTIQATGETALMKVKSNRRNYNK